LRATAISKDSWIGPAYVANLAVIYAWTGEKDLAIEQLELAIAAKGPLGTHYGELKLDPEWDPLRGDPRFEKIVKKAVTHATRYEFVD
jgi:hypothetical protein